jgi:anthranilate 1,2-dioxygenase small subunit
MSAAVLSPTPAAAKAAAPGLRQEAREAIADLLERYCHTLDDDRCEEWSAFFTEDAVYQVTTRENLQAGRPIGIVLCEGRGMLDDRIKALRIANIFESHTHRHVMGRPLIEPRADGGCDARTSFVIYRTMYTGETEVFATGRYDDVLEPGPQGWRIAQRRVVLDSRMVDTLMVYPL